MQTLGTALQLAGAAITLVGVLWAWHALTGYLTRWRDAVRAWPDRLRRALRTTHTGTAQASYGWTGKALGVTPTTGTPEERISQLETRLAGLRADMAETLHAAIDDAMSAEREASQALRLRDIIWAAGGIVVSIIGYVCQLT